MANKYVITVEAGDGNIPVVSGSRHISLINLAKLFTKLSSGHNTSAYTVAARNNAVYASGTVTAAAVAAADTITINGVALTAEQQRATAVVTFSSLANNDTVTLNGFVMTAKTTVTDATTQFALGADDTAAAANCVTLVNATTDSGVYGLITATSALGVVTFRAVTSGTAANSYTIATSNGTRAAITNSATTLANGTAPSNNKFDVSPGSTNTQVGDDIVRCIGASTTALIVKAVTASNASGVVTIQAAVPGILGNAVTLASSNNTRLAVSGSRLTGGLADTVISFAL